MNADYDNGQPGSDRADDRDVRLDGLLRRRYERFADPGAHARLRAELLARLNGLATPAARRSMRPRLARLAAAVLLSALAAWAIFFVPANRADAGMLFASVMEQVRSVQFVRYDQSVRIGDGPTRRCRVDFSSEGREVRRFTDGSVQTTDLARGRITFYAPSDSPWMLVVSAPPEPGDGRASPAWATLAALPDSAGELISPADGADWVFTATGSAGERMTIRADARTRRPLEVRVVNGDVSVVLSHFDWSAGEADVLSATAAPAEGVTIYRVDFSDINSPPGRADLVGALRILSELNGGRTPASLASADLTDELEALRCRAGDLTDLGSGLSLFTGSRFASGPDGKPAMVEALDAWRRLVTVRRGLRFFKSLTTQRRVVEYNGNVEMTRPGNVVLRYRTSEQAPESVIESGDD